MSSASNVSGILLSSALSVLALQGQAQTQQVQVLEYHPAPGQFVNAMPDADESTTQEEVNHRCEEQLASDGLIHLGTFGGYITVKFDHPIENKLGSDILILGNGFYADNDPIYGSATIGGSIEPGIVYVGVGKNLEEANGMSLQARNTIPPKSMTLKLLTISLRQRGVIILNSLHPTIIISNGNVRGQTRMVNAVILPAIIARMFIIVSRIGLFGKVRMN